MAVNIGGLQIVRSTHDWKPYDCYAIGDSHFKKDYIDEACNGEAEFKFWQESPNAPCILKFNDRTAVVMPVRF